MEFFLLHLKVKDWELLSVGKMTLNVHLFLKKHQYKGYKMNKLLILVSSLTLVLGCTSASSKTSDETSTPPQSAEANVITIEADKIELSLQEKESIISDTEEATENVTDYIDNSVDNSVDSTEENAGGEESDESSYDTETVVSDNSI